MAALKPRDGAFTIDQLRANGVARGDFRLHKACHLGLKMKLPRRNETRLRQSAKSLKILVPVEGLEPPTYRLQGGCSTS
jgi:hypothetical protein